MTDTLLVAALDSKLDQLQALVRDGGRVSVDDARAFARQLAGLYAHDGIGPEIPKLLEHIAFLSFCSGVRVGSS